MSTLLAKGFNFKPQTCSGIQIISLQDLQILYDTDICKFILFAKTKCIRYRRKLSVPIDNNISSELFLVHKDETYKITHTLATFLRCIDASIFPDDDDLQNDLIHLESQLEDLHGLFLTRCGAFIKKINSVIVGVEDKLQEDSCNVIEVSNVTAVNDDPTQLIDDLASLEGCKNADVSSNDNKFIVGETDSYPTDYSCQMSSTKDFKGSSYSANKPETSRFDVDADCVDENTNELMANVEENICSSDLIVFDDSFIGYTNEFISVKDDLIYDSFNLLDSFADEIYLANPFDSQNTFELIPFSNCGSDNSVDVLGDVKKTFTKIVVIANLPIAVQIQIVLNLYCFCYQPILIKPQPTDKPPP